MNFCQFGFFHSYGAFFGYEFNNLSTEMLIDSTERRSYLPDAYATLIG